MNFLFLYPYSLLGDSLMILAATLTKQSCQEMLSKSTCCSLINFPQCPSPPKKKKGKKEEKNRLLYLSIRNAKMICNIIFQIEISLQNVPIFIVSTPSFQQGLKTIPVRMHFQFSYDILSLLFQ